MLRLRLRLLRLPRRWLLLLLLRQLLRLPRLLLLLLLLLLLPRLLLLRLPQWLVLLPPRLLLLQLLLLWLLLPRLLLLLLLLEVAAAGCGLRHDDNGRPRRSASVVRQREPRSECHIAARAPAGRLRSSATSTTTIE